MTRQQIIILLLFVLTISLKSNGQESDPLKRKGTTITLDSRPKKSVGEVLLTISVNNLYAALTMNELIRDSVKLNPEWINSLNVIKGNKATEYGERGKYGVILIELKSEVFDELPAYLKANLNVKD